MSILAPKKQIDTILAILQSTKAVELEDILQNEKNQEWIANYFPENKSNEDNQEQHWLTLLSQVKETIEFLKNNGGKNKELSRKELSLHFLEESYDEKSLQTSIDDVYLLKKQWQTVEQGLESWRQKDEWLSYWQTVDFGSQAQTQWTRPYLARVANTNWQQIENFMKEQTIYYEINYSDKKETFFSFLLLRQKEADILKEITSLGVILETNLSVKSPKELAVESEEAKNRLWESKEKLIKKLMKWKQKIPFFQFNEEILLSKLSREKAKELLLNFAPSGRQW